MDSNEQNVPQDPVAETASVPQPATDGPIPEAAALNSDVGLNEAGLSEAGLSEVARSESGLPEAGLSESRLPEAGLSEARPSKMQLSRVRFVLVEPSLSANIGAVARAMKTMGLTQLMLVRPQQAIDAEALARAAGADDLLARAQVCDSLTEALSGCRLVIGSSARARSLAWPEVDPAGCAAQLLQESVQGEVALLLGRERSGLTNDELSHCHFLTRIATNPDYSSLNIAAAAQVFAYELRRTALQWQAEAALKGEQRLAAGGVSAPASAPEPADADAGVAIGLRAEAGLQAEVQAQAQTPARALGRDPALELSRDERDERADLATADEMAGFYGHLEQTLAEIGFADPAQSGTLRRRLRRLFNRARPDRTELNILRGILSAVEGRKRPDRFRR
ncbi:TrmJ/YjtD family RNA methyltransferase [Lamprobacter modestohalophilus]|uniref:RNA methyltransferase n=1 Tax=Lamprobacter modestohalophilus TaxID=1064514 RepID=UPI002ADED145|nr:TrmJ/YjtD family RNA methyltransferase [Lamprobacter modestohalophilus]MEA1050259.1 TrmJ/YjtD family RNA methyltransferase [Lamprobacter modestohalophilus]